MIADRVGQYASGTAPEMLERARRLFALHADADRAYMERRIRHESAGEYGVEDLAKGLSPDTNKAEVGKAEVGEHRCVTTFARHSANSIIRRC